MKFSDTSIKCQKTGDIILTKSKKIGTLIVKGQKYYYNKIGNYSHVVICVIPGIFAEATKGKLVDVFYYKEPSRSLYKAIKWKVIRNSSVASDDLIKQKIIKWISYQIGKPYDLKGLISPRNKKKSLSGINTPVVICSEFVALVYKQVNNILRCKLFDTPSNQIVPADFECLPSDKCSNWAEVNEAELIDSYDHTLMHEYAETWLKHQQFLNSIAGDQADALHTMTTLSDILNDVAKNSDIEMLKIALEGLSSKIKPERIDIDFAYQTFINFVTFGSNFLKEFTPTSYKTSAKAEDVKVQTKMVREKSLKDFDSFLKLQNGVLEKIYWCCNQLENINITSSEDTETFTKITLIAIDLIQTLPLDNIEIYLKKLNNRLENHQNKSCDPDITNRLKELSNIMNKIKELKDSNILTLFKTTVKKVNL